ncbi:hypothetical protein HZH66_000916 [Vespula vulgaris]|uniref:Uncharacterized protein n=1 Tax=Vespula vulgaris TaxID=7454 RepID=A0A834NJ33_VESVU|nr:hypothetical protein HZH66_000916 [Vespula vulgaris]
MSRIRATQEATAGIPMNIIEIDSSVVCAGMETYNDAPKNQKIEPDNLKNPAKNRLSSESEGARHGTGPMGEKKSSNSTNLRRFVKIPAPVHEEQMSKEHKEAAKTELGKERLEA